MSKIRFYIATTRKFIGETIFSKNVAGILSRIEFFLSSDDSILDLGSGTCMLTHILLEKGYSVTPVDIKNKSYYPHIIPLVYNGKKLPFSNNRFDICILIAVLHHIQNPELVLKEAVRVSKKLIIFEDIYTNTFNKYYAYVLDSILNKEFFGHTRANKNDPAWKKTFRTFGLTLLRSDYTRSWGFLQNATYYLTKT